MSLLRSRRRSAASLTLAVALACAAPLAAQADTAPAPDFDATPPQAGEPFYTEQDLAVGGEGGFPNYRIPALAVTNDGDILASYDGRPTAWDAPGPNSILQRRSTDGGVTWEEQTFVHEGKVEAPIEGYSDPSYIVDRHTGDIFNFHVKSFDRGFGNSQPGVDPEARNVLHAEVSVSHDDGETWEHEVITADVTADLGWRSRFAASGQGIQLKYGEHAGRLIQQFTIINAAGTFQAVSVYSDDHGQTWQVGEPVGVGMDENKTVELSDGRVMLNSRDSHRSGYRTVAISEDGGVTYGEVTIDRELPDPTNNASIVRAYPDAPEGSARAKVLLFSNSGSQTSRTNGTIRMSFDDGETWPVAKVFQPGEMAYSTLATLPDGNVGLLYEPGHNGIRFAQFNLAWLQGLAAPLTVADVVADRGETFQVDVQIENQSGRALPEAELSLDLPEGWVLEGTEVPHLLPGASATATATVSVPADAVGGRHTVTATLSSDGTSTSRTFDVEVSLLDQGAFSIAEVSSENPSSGEGAAQAIDGSTSTHWHSAWSVSPAPGYPHHLTVDLGAEHEIWALHYTPRQSGTNGRIGGYEVWTSTDASTWVPATTGTFAPGSATQRVAFDATTARYVRLVATSSIGGDRWASVAELNVEGVR
ncbi:discoidin domain-containing protein [Georgenia daeguensis]|uniref:exo-alpha-sialidase n=1 Tax=Georgenia daeguensis TaxID=908355 RepID=A0ABP8EY56_9MICO